jgi:hypothetical protein
MAEPPYFNFMKYRIVKEYIPGRNSFTLILEMRVMWFLWIPLKGCVSLEDGIDEIFRLTKKKKREVVYANR